MKTALPILPLRLSLSSMVRALVTSLCLTVLPGYAPAQSAPEPTISSFVGAVFDATTSAPVQAAFASAMGTGVWATTDHNGSFRLDRLPPGTHTIRIWRIGYTPTFFTVRLDSNQVSVLDVPIVLRPIPYEMPEIVVEGDRTRLVMGPLREFYRRRNEEEGVFITREQIMLRGFERFDQIFSGIAGVNVDYSGNLENRILMGRGRELGCSPQYFVDGLWTDESMALTMRPEWIEGIEIYRRVSEIPPELNARGLCGVIVIWTRR
jgi:hypothetical protein